MWKKYSLCFGFVVFVCTQSHVFSAKPRARNLGIPFDGTPGKLNAITDVKGVLVGNSTIISGKSARTGVTAILPLGTKIENAVFSGWHSLNGNGEMTGTTWIEESGLLEGPIITTNTFSVGTARDAVIKWSLKKRGSADNAIALPVIAETWDGFLNDLSAFHVQEQHVLEALDSAKAGAVAEGSVGGGTGMKCFEFKCGIGTASRIIKLGKLEYTVGVLVQSNFGLRPQLTIAGIPFGKTLNENRIDKKESGSIIVVIGTDAPLLPQQLKRLARRAAMGIARVGSVSGDGSGDIFLAFSTAHSQKLGATGILSAKFLANGDLDRIFEATIQAVEESVINSLVASDTMVGFHNHKVISLPLTAVQEVLKKHGRLLSPIP